MFSRLLRIPTNFLFPLNTPSVPQPISRSSTPIKKGEVSSGDNVQPMVTTRRQSQLLHHGSEDSVEQFNHARGIGEKKGRGRGAKRRNVDSGTEVMTNGQFSHVDESLEDLDAAAVKDDETNKDANEVHIERNHDMENTDASTATTGASDQGRKKQDKKPTSRIVAGKQEAPSLDRSSGLNSQRQHVRFASQEPEPLLNGFAAEERATEQSTTAAPHSDDEEEEDPPEAVQNVSELRKVQEGLSKAAHAAETKKQMVKEKRRRLDARLKDQAGSKKNMNKVIMLKNGPEPPDDLSWNINADVNDQYQLPDLLPESILNSVPKKQNLDVPQEEKRISKLHGGRRPKPSRPLKDVLVGRTTVRVSKVGSDVSCSSLAPKNASKRGRNTRETWLKSLRGVPGGTRRNSSQPFRRR